LINKKDTDQHHNGSDTIFEFFLIERLIHWFLNFKPFFCINKKFIKQIGASLKLAPE